jgi:hypothetical protein
MGAKAHRVFAMPQFFARIELHKTKGREPRAETYDLLHHAAKDRKLERKLTVTHPDGTSQEEYLPSGFYTLFTPATIDVVLELAKDAAATTGFEASVVVGEVTGKMLVNNLKSRAQYPTFQ